jgi:uncharacterized protein (TIGR02996 family)
MNEWQALMFAVCESPDDDTPRLVLADWLEEHGEPERAEFIRLQIQLARGTHRPNQKRDLQRREQQLLTLHGRRWQLEIGSGGYYNPQFVRGFLEDANLTADDLECALEAAPLRSVALRGAVDLLAVMQLPHVARLRLLDIEYAEISETDTEAFAETDWPAHPKQLVLPRCEELPELRSRILERFKDWVRFGRW